MMKREMQEWVGSLEVVIDNKLCKWKKEPKLENGESVHLGWQFTSAHIEMDIFWEDQQETVSVNYRSPRHKQEYLSHRLSDRTFNEIIGYVSILEHVTAFPPHKLYGLNG